jgi:hypothetical protein
MKKRHPSAQCVGVASSKAHAIVVGLPMIESLMIGIGIPLAFFTVQAWNGLDGFALSAM